MNKVNSIYDFIQVEEANYKLPIPMVDGWDWSMREHIRLSTLYKNSQYSTGKDDNKPYKNIIRPILNLQYRAEGFDVKDIEMYVNDKDNFYKSFLVKKFHNNWAPKNNIDTFIDELVETYCTYGGVLVKNVNQVRPEVVPWQSIAFVDQTDILSGPICIKHYYSPDQLLEMAQSGWGDEKNGATATLQEVITLAEDSKVQNNQTEQKAKTPGKYIEVYETHGSMPIAFLEDSDTEVYVKQLHITCKYTDVNGQSKGITLFRGEEKESIFKFLARDAIFGRALGFGGVEELFEAQVWTNYGEIRMKELLDAAAKVIHLTDDDAFYNRNARNLSNVKNNEILVIAEGRSVKQMDTTPRNINLFDRSVQEWEMHAQQMGAANDSIMGKQPASGTPFALQELVTQESHSLHEYRKGKLATFVEEIYRDWIIPYISKEITKGQEFLSELDLEEMQFIVENIMVQKSNELIIEKILNGEIPDPQLMELYKQEVKQEFMGSGNKKFVKILKDEMKDAPVDVKINIAGKQKDLVGDTAKLTNIFRTIISAPQVLQMPGMAKLFNQILESSGLSPVDFSQMTAPQQPQTQPNNNQPMPQEQMAQ